MNKDIRMKGFATRTSVEDAVDWVDERSRQQREHQAVEQVWVTDAAGRSLAEPIQSRAAVPGFRRSMMDGYAVFAGDVLGSSSYNPISLQITGEVLPGQNCKFDLNRGEAARVMTGAEIPKSANSVVPVEFTELDPSDERRVQILASIAEQKNVAKIGEDIALGETIFPAERILRPQDVGVLSSVGIGQVKVWARPRVRIIVTGNELLPPGSLPDGVQIVDSNSPMLTALIRRDGGIPIHPGIVPDEPDAILEALHDDAEIVLVSGGSSVGKEDYAPVLVQQHGQLPIHGISMRPSSPAGMGMIGDRVVFLLPGNPVSCLCAYDFFAGRCLRQLNRRPPDWPYPKLELPLKDKLVSQIGRTDYARVRITDGQVEPIAISGASILSSTSRAEGFCVVEATSEGAAAGEIVTVFLYDT